MFLRNASGFGKVSQAHYRLAGLLAICTALAAGCEKKSAPVAAVPPASVTVALPVERDVTEYEEFSGHTAAKDTVAVRARVTGYLEKIEFVEGAEVKTGDLLYVIDRRPFQAAYDKAMAQIAVAQANLKYRMAELGRNKELVRSKAVTLSELDQSQAANDEAAATLVASQAVAEGDKLNLDFTEYRAPIDGAISKTGVTKGNLVTADQTTLTTIVSLDPIYVYFDADEQMVLRLRTAARDGKVKHDEQAISKIFIGLANEEGCPHEGVIDFADVQVSLSTGTIQVRGLFANPRPEHGNRLLLPGLTVRVRVPVGQRHKALLVTEQALGTDQGQKYLLVVDDKQEVQYRRVTLGKLEAGLRVIEDGLQAGERVIVAGLQRVRPGVKVEAKKVEMATFSK